MKNTLDAIKKVKDLLDKDVERLWRELEDVSMNPLTECIDEPFADFPTGTPRNDIWEWFDRAHSKGVGYLMNEYEYPAEEKAVEKRIYVCSPLRNHDPAVQESNRLNAIEYAKLSYESACDENSKVAGFTVRTFAPHGYLSQLLDDEDPRERRIALHLCMEVIQTCTEMHVYGPFISNGMAEEICYAFKLGITVISKSPAITTEMIYETMANCR